MSRSDIERVRDAVNLVTLISEYVPLQQKGREWKGVCPFHDDHAPSMHVVTHRETEFYKCFSCGAYGDCFKFIQEYLKKDFGEIKIFRINDKLLSQVDGENCGFDEKIIIKKTNKFVNLLVP